MSTFGKFFRGLRVARGLTQESLARDAGLATRTVVGIERSDRPNLSPATERLALIAFDNAMPLTEAELAEWVRYTGLHRAAMTFLDARPNPSSTPSQREPSNIEVIGRGPPATVALPDDTRDGGMRLASALALCLKRATPDEVAAMLEGWGAARPESAEESLPKRTIKIELGEIGEGDARRHVSIYAPTDPPPASPQQPRERARKKQA